MSSALHAQGVVFKAISLSFFGNKPMASSILSALARLLGAPRDEALPSLVLAFRAVQRVQGATVAARPGGVHHLAGTAAFPPRCLDSTLISNAARFARYSSASYTRLGRAFFAVVGSGAAGPQRTLHARASGLVQSLVADDADSLAHVARLDRGSVLFASDSASAGVPRHFLVACAESRSLVLVIRGTLTLADAATDLSLETTAFCGGVAHAGIAGAARTIWVSVRAAVAGFFTPQRREEGWGLVVTGHSLGGATAALLAVLLHHERDSAAAAGAAHPLAGLDIDVWAYAPPPCFAPLAALPPHVHASIVCWVHRGDFVCALSLDSLLELLRVLRVVASTNSLAALAGAWGEVDWRAVREAEPAWAREWLPQEATAAGPHGPSTPAAGALPTAGQLQIPGTLFVFRAPHEDDLLDDPDVPIDSDAAAAAAAAGADTPMDAAAEVAAAAVVQSSTVAAAAAAESAPPAALPGCEGVFVSSGASVAAEVTCDTNPVQGDGRGGVGNIATPTADSSWDVVNNDAWPPHTALANAPSPAAPVTPRSLLAAAGRMRGAVAVRLRGAITSAVASVVTGAFAVVTATTEAPPQSPRSGRAAADAPDLPLVTCVRASDLRSLAVYESALMDHTPEKYFHGLAQLADEATRLSRRRSSGTAAASSSSASSSCGDGGSTAAAFAEPHAAVAALSEPRTASAEPPVVVGFPKCVEPPHAVTLVTPLLALPPQRQTVVPLHLDGCPPVVLLERSVERAGGGKTQ